jgi:hypothetical protein
MVVASACTTSSGGQVDVDLDGSQLGCHVLQHLGGAPRARPDLQHVVAEIQIGEGPRQDVLLDRLGPLVAATQLQMQLVHAASLHRGSGNIGVA